jgi:hypothetical protein
MSFNKKTEIIEKGEYSLLVELLSAPAGSDGVFVDFLGFLFKISVKNIEGIIHRKGTNVVYSGLILQKIIFTRPDLLNESDIDSLIKLAEGMMNSETMMAGTIEAALGILCACTIICKPRAQKLQSLFLTYIQAIMRPKKVLLISIRTTLLLSSALALLSSDNDTFFHVSVTLSMLALQRSSDIAEKEQVEVSNWCASMLTPHTAGKQLFRDDMMHELNDSDDDGHAMMHRRGSHRSMYGGSMQGVENEILSSIKLLDYTQTGNFDPYELIRDICTSWKNSRYNLLVQAINENPYLIHVLKAQMTCLPKQSDYLIRRVYKIKRLSQFNHNL